MNGNKGFLDEELLETPVVGRNLAGTTLGENLAEATLVVFLRHFG